MAFWAAAAPALISAGASIIGKAMDGGGGAQGGSAGFTPAGHDAAWQFRHDLTNRAEAYGQHGLDAFNHQFPHAQNMQGNAANFGSAAWGLTDMLVPQAQSFFAQAGTGNDAFQQALNAPSRAGGGGGGGGGGARPSLAPAELPDAPEGATTYAAPEINEELLAQFDQVVGGYADAVEGHVLPTFQQLSEAAQRFSSPAYAQQLATQSAGDVGRAFNQTQDAIDRRNMAMGANPNSGRAQEAQRQGGIENIAMRAGAANAARLTADQVGFDRLAAAAQQGGMLGQLGNQALGLRSEYDTSRMNTLAGLEQARMGNETNLYGTQVQGITSMHNAGLSAGASMYGADRSAQASMYGSDRSAEIGRLNAMNTRDLGMGALGLQATGLIGDLHNQSSMVQQRAGDFGNNVFGNFLDSQYNTSGLIQNANTNVLSAFGGASARQPGVAPTDGYGAALASLGGDLANRVDWGSIFSGGGGASGLGTAHLTGGFGA